MKRLDRAMYGLFLLVLLADVARLHAVPGEPNGDLIFRTATRFGESQPGAASLDRRKPVTPFSKISGFKRISLRLSGWTNDWTRNFSEYAAPVLQFDSASAPALAFIPPSFAAIPSLAVFEHSASPAP
jgi:hypothetical protein